MDSGTVRDLREAQRANGKCQKGKLNWVRNELADGFVRRVDARSDQRSESLLQMREQKMENARKCFGLQFEWSDDGNRANLHSNDTNDSESSARV